jgi:hypothetical protein
MERSVRDLIKTLSQNSLGGTEESHAIPQDFRCPGRDTNRAPPECAYRGLPLTRPVTRRYIEDGCTVFRTKCWYLRGELHEVTSQTPALLLKRRFYWELSSISVKSYNAATVRSFPIEAVSSADPCRISLFGARPYLDLRRDIQMV